jgi:hypothetical protein
MKRRNLIAFFVAALAAVDGGHAQFFFFSTEPALTVAEPANPMYFDPYYNRPKIYTARPVVYSPAPVYYETKRKRTHGNKVTEKITIRNQYGKVIYQDKKTKKKKK